MPEVQLAVSENVIRTLFAKLRDGFQTSLSDSTKLGDLYLAYSLVAKLENGKIDLHSSGSVLIDELDIVLDRLRLTLGLDLPKICVGGQCIVPNPFGGCLVRLPRVCVFENDPDIKVEVPLDRLVRLEVSGMAKFRSNYYNNPQKGTLSDWEAHAQGKANRWQIFLDPGWLDFDDIDIADIVADIFERVTQRIIDELFSWLPDWARDIIDAILGGLADLVRFILDFGDDIEEWLIQRLHYTFNVWNLVVTYIVDEYLAKLFPIFEFEDPYPMLPSEARTGGPQLVPVLIPIREPAIYANDKELVFSASIGA